jgi:hypothetical protein
MNLIAEQLVVGFFTLFIYLLLLPFRLPFYTLLFFDGFLKHFIGYYIGLQTLFCDKHKPGTKSIVSLPQLIAECILEGILFVIFGSVLHKLQIKKHLIPYIIAFSIHTIVSYTGIHDIFLKHRCK